MGESVECVGTRKIIIKVSEKWRPMNLWHMVLWRWLWERMDNADRRYCLTWAHDHKLWPPP